MNAVEILSAETAEVIATVDASSYVRLTTGAEFTGEPSQTLYLDPIEARQLAHALLRAAVEAADA